MASPAHPKRCKTDPAKSTPKIRILHPAYCKGRPEDLKRMRKLINKDPSLLYKEQPEPLRTRKDRFLGPGMMREENRPAAIFIQPLWSAVKAQHLACVNLILQAASTPQDIKNEFKFNESSQTTDDILTFYLNYGKNDDTCCEIMKSLLDHGLSPNVEIPISEIENPHGLVLVQLGAEKTSHRPFARPFKQGKFSVHAAVPVLRQYKATKLILPTGFLHRTAAEGHSKMLELLLEHGAYPEPVILTESGSTLPLYPTLGRHLNPIPAIHHPGVSDKRLTPLLTEIFLHHVTMKHVEVMKILLVHGAVLPTHYLSYDPEMHCQVVSSYVSYPFDVIIRMRKNFVFQVHNAGVNPWGVKSDGSMCQYYDIILEVLKLYHQFGGSLWGKINSSGGPCEGGTGECLEWLRDPRRVTPCKTIIDLLEEHIPHFEEPSFLVEEVRRMMSTPPSLQHSARLAIRRSMGYGCVRNLEALPLPDGLKKYLKFEVQ